MRSIVGMGVAAALAVAPGTSTEIHRVAFTGVARSGGVAPSPSSSPSPSPSPSSSSSKPLTASNIPPEWKNVTTLRVSPGSLRQRSEVRLFVHCPTNSNHATVGSTAFNLKGSRRLYREVGLGLSQRGIGIGAVVISYYALLGIHEVHLRCVQVKISHKTRLRRIRVLSSLSVPLLVRRFDIRQFFPCDEYGCSGSWAWTSEHKKGKDPKKTS
ncbi:hypothetical protein [Streptosporangium sp. NPDC051022]|uniref:hypothetical protein n=1 Tax=Streptosporangium sp. NPDC051022 TaxID=3155752 RepID=UPI003411F766